MVLGLGVVLGLQFIDVDEMLVTVAGAANKEIGYTVQQLHGSAHTYAKVFHFLIKLCQTRNLLTRTIEIVQCKEYCCGVCVVNSDRVLCYCTTIIRGHMCVISCEHRPCSDIADTRAMSILIHIIQKDQLNLWCNYRIATQLIEVSYVATQLIICYDITNLLF